MQINNNFKQNNISYKSVKIAYKEHWPKTLLNEILTNKEIKKASNYLEKRNSSMEFWIENNDIRKHERVSISCTYDRRYQPHGEYCPILNDMSLQDALTRLKNFNSRKFIAFVKKKERCNTEKKKYFYLYHKPHIQKPTTNNNSIKKKILNFFGI